VPFDVPFSTIVTPGMVFPVLSVTVPETAIFCAKTAEQLKRLSTISIRIVFNFRLMILFVLSLNLVFIIYSTIFIDISSIEIFTSDLPPNIISGKALDLVAPSSGMLTTTETSCQSVVKVTGRVVPEIG